MDIINWSSFLYAEDIGEGLAMIVWQLGRSGIAIVSRVRIRPLK